ncbi:MAG: DUF4293 family protein [Chitinophagaceae bacterium]|nr:DUF4293 family protein [Chitinophagaceae bacterium]
MIQRQQTLWLLLATLAALLSFLFPFAVGGEKVGNAAVPVVFELDAGSRFLLMILTGATLCLSTVTIFLFKNRKQQMILCLVGLFISVLLVIMYVSQTGKLIKPTLALWSIFPFLIVAGYFMAFRLIRKDEKLIKTLDKLR